MDQTTSITGKEGRIVGDRKMEKVARVYHYTTKVSYYSGGFLNGTIKSVSSMRQSRPFSGKAFCESLMNFAGTKAPENKTKMAIHVVMFAMSNE